MPVELFIASLDNGAATSGASRTRRWCIGVEGIARSDTVAAADVKREYTQYFYKGHREM